MAKRNDNGKTNMIVMKFGGTSMGDVARIRQAAEIVRGTGLPTGGKVVVLSAMSGVTNALISAAHAAEQGNTAEALRLVEEIVEKHRRTASELVPQAAGEIMTYVQRKMDRVARLCESIAVLGELTPRALDMISSMGERFSVRLVAAALQQIGCAAQPIEAAELIVTNDQFGSAVPLMEQSQARIRECLLPLVQQGIIPVVTGFMGATTTGIVTTLGRGGSDYSAAILGNCLDADEVQIWTDVDGVMTADPRVVPTARTLPVLSYTEAAELSYFGAKVLHPKTILPVVEKSIPLRIANTFHPTHPGTLIVEKPQKTGKGVKAIASIKGVSLLTVQGKGMMGVPGVAARVFSAVAREKVSVLMISQSSSEQNICFVVEEPHSQQLVQLLEADFREELLFQHIDRIWAQDGVVVIAVVGAGMRGTPGIAAKLFGALGKPGINVLSIAQGSSEYNLSLAVDARDADDAVRHIHQEFRLDSTQ